MDVCFTKKSHVCTSIHALFLLLDSGNTCLQYCPHSGAQKKVNPAAFAASRSNYSNP